MCSSDLGDDGSTGTHDVAIPGHGDDCLSRVSAVPCCSICSLLHEGLAHANGIDGLNCLVGAQAHDALHPVSNGRFNDVAAPKHVGHDRLDGEELT